ncbi:MAG: GTP 3',8-cyclase MoaA [Desulfobacterota bacterium]|nr:GTP 3',8-cyclase MoaA [Thermodesulfobacteriota bacterium]
MSASPKRFMQKLIDSYNRPINYLRMSVTDRCNLRCIYCMPREGVSAIGHDEILRYEELIRIARVAASRGITKIRITGGEPLVRRNIVAFIAQLSRLPGITDLSMTTNGILLHRYAEQLRAAGLNRLNISLDSLDPDRYRAITRGGNLSLVLAGIRKAREVGFAPIKINVVAMRGINDDEFVAFARLTLDRPIDIRFIEFMPVGASTPWEHERFISAPEIEERIGTIGTLTEEPLPGQHGPARMYRLDQAQGRIGFITALSNHFCSACNRLRLTADGKLRTCLFSDDEIDLKTLLRNGCSDQELEHRIAAAIAAKPLRHRALEPAFKKCMRTMSSIGG